MQNPRDILLSLIRSALWNVPPGNVYEDVDWGHVCSLARQHTLTGLLADGIQKLPQASRPDGKLIHQLQTFMMKNIQAHMLITRRLGEILAVLRTEGVEPVLLKGHGLAANYPDPISRQCGDIDLYVGKKEYGKAVAVCMKHFKTSGKDQENLKHYNFDNQGIEVELHRIAEILPGVAADRRYQAWTEANLSSAELRCVDIEGVSVTLPPYRFDAVYVMYHAWHHFVNGGIGLRQICDWTMYIHKYHDRLDIHVLESDLNSFGLMKIWHLFSWIAVNKLGLPAEECPLYEGKYAADAEKMMDIVWGDGNYGRYSERSAKRPKGYMHGKLHSLWVTTKRYFRIFSVYPSHIFLAWMRYIFSGFYHYVKGMQNED